MKLPFKLKLPKWFPRKRKKPKNIAIYYRTPRITRAKRKGAKVPKKKGRGVSLPFKLDFITRRKKSLITIAAFLLVIAAVSVVFFSRFFYIDAIVVNRTDLYVNSAAIAKAMEGIKGKHILLLDTGEMERVIYEKFPEIKRVTVERVLPRALRVQLTSYDVLARIKNQDGEEFFINEAGVAVGQEAEQKDLPLIEIPKYSGIPEEEQELFVELVQVKEYKQVMSQEQLYFILEAKRLFEEGFSVPVTHISYLPIEDEVRMQTDKGFWVWMNVRDEAEGLGETVGWDKQFLEMQIEKLKVVINELNIYQTPLAYVDLRINGKVIYCEEGAECASLFNRLQ